MNNQTPTQVVTLQKFIQGDTLKAEMAKVLPKHLPPERMARIAWTAIVRNPALEQCERNSLATAIMLCCQAGLEPDGRNAHLIPFGKVVQVIFDYKGLIALAKRNGVDVRAALVCSQDEFEYQEDDGTGRTLVSHRFSPFEERGKVIGVYSRALEAGKAADYEFMSAEEVEAVRQRSRAGKNGPWVTDWNEMAKKTVIKRHSKRWDLLPEIADVINREDDTPPPLNEPKVSAPMFKQPEPKTIEAQAEVVPDPEPAAEPQAPAGMNPVKALRGLCRESKVKEAALLSYLLDIGSAPDCQSLEELCTVAADVAGMCINDWQSVVEAMQKGNGAK